MVPLRARSSLAGVAGASLVLAVLVYLGLALLCFDQVEEDAFLYYRVAENLADGAGYRFNPDGERIETGSSVLWQLALAGLAGFPIDLVIAGKLLGILVGVLCLFALDRLARGVIPDPRLARLPVWLLAVSVPFVMGTQRGLESPLALLALLLFALCAVEQAAHRWLGAAASLILLARPEGVFVATALLVLTQLAWRRHEGRHFGRQWLVFGLVTALLFAARLAYFHDVFGSPFYAKFGFAMEPFVPIGAWALRSFFVLPSIALGVALLHPASRRPEIAVILGIAALSGTWHVIANDYMPYVRHLLPAIALVPLASVAVLAPWASRGRRKRAAIVLGFALYAGLAFGVAPATGTHGRVGPSPPRQALVSFATHPSEHVALLRDLFRSPRPPLTPFRERLALASLPSKGLVSPSIGRIITDAVNANYQAFVGEFLRRNYPDGTTVVYDQMGQTPYYAGAGFAFIDTAGLAERTIGLHLYKSSSAQSGRMTNRFYVSARDALFPALFGEAPLDPAHFRGIAYVLDAEPDVVLVNSVSGGPGSLIHALIRAPRFQAEYVLRYRLAGIVLGYERRGRFPERSFEAPSDLPFERADRCLTLPAPRSLFPMLEGVPQCPIDAERAGPAAGRNRSRTSHVAGTRS